jgi:hypothetical protein
VGTVRAFRQKFTLEEDAIGSHACSLLQASRRVTNDIPLGCPLFLPVHTVNCVQTLKVTVRKEPSNFGYDWSPITETQGLWLPVYLVGQAKVIILDVVATVHVKGGLNPTVPLLRGDVEFEVKVVTRVNLTSPSTVVYSVGGNWSSAPATRSVKLSAGVSEVVDMLPAADVELWWPAGCGARFQTGFCTRGCHWIPRMFA